MHREACVAGDLVETLTAVDRLLYHVLVAEDLVLCKQTTKGMFYIEIQSDGPLKAL